MGNNERRCPELKTHDEIMIRANEDKYIGDILSNDGKINKTIKARTMKGIGISQVLHSMERIGKHTDKQIQRTFLTILL